MTTIDGERVLDPAAQPRPRRALGAWAGFALKRAIGLVVTFFVAIVVTFVAIQLIPGDPAVLAAGSDATPQQVEVVRTSMGLDKPVATQFVDYLSGAVRGDFGTSFSVHSPVSEVLMSRLPYTLSLAGRALPLILLFSSPWGSPSGPLTPTAGPPGLASRFASPAAL